MGKTLEDIGRQSAWIKTKTQGTVSATLRKWHNGSWEVEYLHPTGGVVLVSQALHDLMGKTFPTRLEAKAAVKAL